MSVSNSISKVVEQSFWASIDRFRKQLLEEQHFQTVRNQSNAMDTQDSSKTLQANDTISMEQQRAEILKKIESTIEQLLKSIKLKQSPFLLVPNRRSWDNTKFNEETGLALSDTCTFVKMRFDTATSVQKFTLTVKMLSIIYQLVQRNTYATKRDIYYQYQKVFGFQGYVDSLVDMIAAMFRVPRHQLHVLATPKGFMAGDLQYRDHDGSHVDLRSKQMGHSVPHHIDLITNVSSKAKFILIVEKDAVFSYLMEENILNKIGQCIMITGRGMPDVNTRQMVKLLWDTLTIPIFAVVDADPYGIEIMSVYKYGSLQMSYDVGNLAVPAVKWLGLLPSDIKRLRIPESEIMPLNRSDTNKLNDLLLRPHVQQNSSWVTEIQQLLTCNMKAEIESLSKIAPSYLLNVFIPQKVQSGGWL